MPPELTTLFNSMVKHDWLMAYTSDIGLDRAMSGLNSKIKSGPDMRLSIPIMHENYDYLNSKFIDFFTILQTYCHNFILSHR